VGGRDADPTSVVPPDVLRLVALPEERRALLLHVSDLVDQIAFGTVVVVLHEGNVTQIETSEKIRLTLPDRGSR
jgi:hypothetical protein